MFSVVSQNKESFLGLTLHVISIKTSLLSVYRYQIARDLSYQQLVYSYKKFKATSKNSMKNCFAGNDNDVPTQERKCVTLIAAI